MYNFVYSCQLTLLGTHTAEWKGYGAAYLMACDWLVCTYTKAFVGCNRKDVHLVVIGDWYTHTLSSDYLVRLLKPGGLVEK